MHAVEFSKTAAPLGWEGISSESDAARDLVTPERAVESSAPGCGSRTPRPAALLSVPRRERVAAGLPAPQGAFASDNSDPPELALAELQHAAVQRGRRHVQRIGRRPARRRASRRPAASLRRASERDPPKSSTITCGRCSGPAVGGDRRLLDVRRAARARRTRGRSRPRPRPPRPAPWKRSTSARASARFASRGPTSAGAALPQQQRRTTAPSSSSGIDSVSPYISSGGVGDPDLVAEGLRHLARRRRARSAAATSARPAAAGRTPSAARAP